MYYAEVMVALKDLENKEKAKILSSFFKTGKGEYGYGDVFLGVQMPKQRKVAKKFSGLPLKEIKRLLKTTVHEHRMTALLILILQYKRADESRKKELFEFYLENTKGINNWDLVDVSASDIVGNYLLDREKSIIYELAKSNNLWERRIAIISTFEFIKNNRFDDTLKISEILLNDTHDLIHKAVGWMLREVGKKDQGAEERFLDKHYNVMPRTMLRYAIERFSDEKRMHYLGRDTRKKKEDKAISISTTKSKLDRKLIHDFLKDS